MAGKKKNKKAEATAEEKRDRFFIRARRFAIRGLKISAVAIVLFAVGFFFRRLYYFLCWSPYFKVRRVEVIGGSKEFSRELLDFVGLDETEDVNVNLVRLDTRWLKKRLLEFPKLRSAEALKSYPSTLKIYVQPRRAAAVVSGEGLYLADSEGAVMEPLKPAKRGGCDYPIITGLEAEKIAPGKVIGEESYFKALDVQTKLRRHCSRLYDNLSELNLNDRGEIAMIFRGGTEIRLGRRDALDRLPELEHFLQEYAPSRRGYEKFEYVDLRFRKQIVYALRDEARERIAE